MYYACGQGLVSMSKKLLVICGPTGVGKTKLAFRLARKFDGELVSADSRQVYKGLSLVTGKDEIEGVKTWLVSVVDAGREFSVAHYSRLAWGAIEDIWGRGKLPILVGGTGFYIKAVVDGVETLDIPPDKGLREAYKEKSLSELLEILKRCEPGTADLLNESERKNKQRLIRRIEVGRWRIENRGWTVGGYARLDVKDVLFIGLKASREVLRERINRRVDEWMSRGAQKEIKSLIEGGVGWGSQVMTALGCRSFKDYFEGKISREEAFERWKRADWQYAKRQMSWFARDERINWFDITDAKFPQNVYKMAQKWYDIW